MEVAQAPVSQEGEQISINFLPYFSPMVEPGPVCFENQAPKHEFNWG